MADHPQVIPILGSAPHRWDLLSHECLEWPLGWPVCRIWMDKDRVLHREPLVPLELAVVEAIDLVGRLTL